MHALETKSPDAFQKSSSSHEKGPSAMQGKRRQGISGKCRGMTGPLFLFPSETASYPNIENAVYGCGGDVGGVILGTVLRCHVFDCYSNLKLGDQHFL